MTKQAIVINGLEFKFQKDAIAYFKEMLGRYRNGQTVAEYDHEMLMGLLERHPEADKKIGCGVKRFYKAKTDMSTSCFWIDEKIVPTPTFPTGNLSRPRGNRFIKSFWKHVVMLFKMT